jgi:hypothetical protein
MPEPESIKKKRHIQALVELTWQWENTQAKSYENSVVTEGQGKFTQGLGVEGMHARPHNPLGVTKLKKDQSFA